jgi:hypothetical protein
MFPARPMKTILNCICRFSYQIVYFMNDTFNMRKRICSQHYEKCAKYDLIDFPETADFEKWYSLNLISLARIRNLEVF